MNNIASLVVKELSKDLFLICSSGTMCDGRIKRLYATPLARGSCGADVVPPAPGLKGQRETAFA
jgi:hypothetical protein